ncbi:hypothetical protein TrCOL_g10485 [Triparma columacea]|uniref:3-dehydroquinate synthase N-terminal domain-containing protein n=1 Tax=Triparma columacea TaxID=722753 RepID=A0A9W7GM95_9STRA|nr:hypothetical protein TrCOL_g10485 [Triparma columacea]
MSKFLPNASNTLYEKVPTEVNTTSVQINYNHVEDLSSSELLSLLVKKTPLPKGKDAFSGVHIIAPPLVVEDDTAEASIASLVADTSCSLPRVVHRLSSQAAPTVSSAMVEYETIFAIGEKLLLEGADRATLVVFVGWEDEERGGGDFYAALIGMLPFRGLTVALLTQRTKYNDLLNYNSPSGVFHINAGDSARMGMFPIKAVFGPLADKTVKKKIGTWHNINTSKFINHKDQESHPTTPIPFKIGGLTLPMMTHNGSYNNSLSALSDMLSSHYDAGYFPIVSSGETCDALGYGSDVLEALKQPYGYYFTHKSGESYKCWTNYGTKELFRQISLANSLKLTPVILAVGGGVNGNCIGLIAAMTGADLVEIPTTPMHFNDATTSAKKAFSLVKECKILSKNILGAFYIPKLVFCISETFLTLSSANAHATVGEACKTMNMLGVANSGVGASDYSNILGAKEFASDFTKIVKNVGGFDTLLSFINDSKVQSMKAEIINIGREIRDIKSGCPTINCGVSGTTMASLQSIASLAPTGSSSGSLDEEDGVSEFNGNAGFSPSTAKLTHKDTATLDALVHQRRELMTQFRANYYSLGDDKVTKIKNFLTTINKEIVSAKAMFLAYSDPFEKYRALLFEYAHTLGHGVEAYANLCYYRAEERGIEIPPEAVKLHGQCVGMAVQWAGAMSNDLGVLTGDGFKLHQCFVYLFNRFGGFDFAPLRALFDSLGVTREEFVEGVLAVVRRDNKRGYCACSDPSKSVDQLVTQRPGKMLRSDDENAELRYLVEVDEEWQSNVLKRAWDCEFDNIADINDAGELDFVRSEGKGELVSSSEEVGEFLWEAVNGLYMGGEVA